MTVTTFTLLILFLYLVGVKAVSYFAFKRSTNSTDDYFLARRNVPLFALVATTVASIFSTGTVVSSPSEFFTKGVDYFWIFFFSVMPVVMMPLVVKFWRLGKERGYVTPGEMMGDLYQSRSVQLLFAIIGLLCLVPYSTAQLVAVGKTFEVLTEGIVSYQLGVTIGCLAIGIYLYFGGSRAVIWTDVVQGTIFAILLVVSSVLVVSWAGGWSAVMSGALESHPERFTFHGNIKYYEMVFPCLTFFLLPYVWQRMFMARSATIVAKNVVVIPVVFALFFFAAWLIGVSALVIFPDGLGDGDSLIGAIFSQHAPYFGAFVLVAAFAAGMSTVDSQLLSAGSIFTHDLKALLEGWLGKKITSMSDYRFARLTTLLLMVIIFIWSLFLQSRSVFSLVILGVSLTVVFMPSVFAVFYWKRASATASIVSLLLGLVLFLLREFTSLIEHLPSEFGMLGSVSWAVIGSFGGYLGVGLSCHGQGQGLDELCSTRSSKGVI